MFDIGWSELLVIGVVAIIVVGPKDLPRLMRTFGHYAGKVRRMAAEFQRQFEEAVRDSEIDEVRKAMQDFHNEAPKIDLRAPADQPLMVPQQTPTSAPGAVAAASPPAVPAQPAPKKRAKRAAALKPKATLPQAAKAGEAKLPPPKPPKPKPPKPKPPKPKAPKPKAPQP
jgi:sec-independent protein translocase protein TatB